MESILVIATKDSPGFEALSLQYTETPLSRTIPIYETSEGEAACLAPPRCIGVLYKLYLHPNGERLSGYARTFDGVQSLDWTKAQFYHRPGEGITLVQFKEGVIRCAVSTQPDQEIRGERIEDWAGEPAFARGPWLDTIVCQQLPEGPIWDCLIARAEATAGVINVYTNLRCGIKILLGAARLHRRVRGLPRELLMAKVALAIGVRKINWDRAIFRARVDGPGFKEIRIPSADVCFTVQQDLQRTFDRGAVEPFKADPKMRGRVQTVMLCERDPHVGMILEMVANTGLDAVPVYAGSDENARLVGYAHNIRGDGWPTFSPEKLIADLVLMDGVAEIACKAARFYSDGFPFEKSGLNAIHVPEAAVVYDSDGHDLAALENRAEARELQTMAHEDLAAVSMGEVSIFGEMPAEIANRTLDLAMCDSRLCGLRCERPKGHDGLHRYFDPKSPKQPGVDSRLEDATAAANAAQPATWRDRPPML